MAPVLFIGWFLMAFGFLAFLVALVGHLMGRHVRIWDDFYVANFGLALLAVAAIGLSKQGLFPYALLSLTAGVIGFVASRMSFARHRLTPIVLPLPLVLILPWATAQTGFWTCQFVGVLCVVLGLVAKGSEEAEARSALNRS